jgi:hypothetical protein
MSIFHRNSVGFEEDLHSLHHLLDYLLLAIHHRFERIESFWDKALKDWGTCERPKEFRI